MRILLIALYGCTVPALRLNKENTKPETVPVVYMWLGTEHLPEYFEKTVKASAKNNEVIILVQKGQRFTSEFPSTVSFVDLKKEYIDHDQAFFEHKGKGEYQHWGKYEPWEKQNLQRSFVLKRWLEDSFLVDRGQYGKDGKHREHIFFADGDVAVFSNVSALWNAPDQYSHCTSAISMPDQTVESMRWSAWIGSAFLNHQLLVDFQKFAKEMYTSQYIHHLELKKQKAPYVCDMTLWYLFAAAAGRYQDAHSKLELPKVSTSASELCNTMEVRGGAHFDATGHVSYKTDHLKIDANGATYDKGKTRLHSLHFQGPDKKSIPKILKDFLKSKDHSM